MLIVQTTRLSAPRLLESVYREWTRGLPVGFKRLNRYVIYDVITHISIVQYNVYSSWCPEFTCFNKSSPLVYIVTEIDLLMFIPT